jgi:Tfp pilus assembly protein PilE
LLNSASYTSNLTGAYTGRAADGPSVTSGKSADKRYTFSVAATTTIFAISATPVAGTRQASDGKLTINESGQRTLGSRRGNRDAAACDRP